MRVKASLSWTTTPPKGSQIRSPSLSNLSRRTLRLLAEDGKLSIGACPSSSSEALFTTMTPRETLACDAQRLLQLVRDGDDGALEQITRCYGSHLLAVGRRQCGDGMAEDAVQDALESAASHLSDFRAEGSLEGWLARMVVNACRRMQRGRKADPSIHEEFVEESVSDPGSSTVLAADSLAIHNLGEELLTALQTLKPQDRAIVLLAEVNGWKGPEIAKSLKLTPTQVRTRLSRSRVQLRAELTKVWSDWSPSSSSP